MDELKLSLTGGANGYTVRLRELYVKGASNYTVEDIKLGSTFEAVIRMPALILDAHYTRCVRVIPPQCTFFRPSTPLRYYHTLYALLS